jgi:hypothetical protein
MKYKGCASAVELGLPPDLTVLLDIIGSRIGFQHLDQRLLGLTFIASNEVSVAASVVLIRKPASSCGKQLSLGADRNRDRPYPWSWPASDSASALPRQHLVESAHSARHATMNRTSPSEHAKHDIWLLSRVAAPSARAHSIGAASRQ